MLSLFKLILVKNRKLIYILNHYSKNSESHFFHVLNLLEVIASHDVRIALVIEKCDDLPQILNKNITLYPQKSLSKVFRPLELLRLLFALNKKGYKHVFIRISWVAALVAILASFFTRQKTFYWLSGQGSFEHYRNLKFGFSKLKLFFASRVPFFIIKNFIFRFVTGPESMKEYFILNGHVNPEKILILYNDIDLKRFTSLDEDAKNRLKSKFDIDVKTKIIFFAHRFSPVRRTTFYIPYIMDVFFENMKDENYIFIVAGSGPEEPEIKEIIAQSSFTDKVRLLGSIPNSIIQEFYQIADIFINPTFAEGFPRVLIEAMASGLPCVTTDAGGIKDIIHNEQSRYMVAKENREAFAEKLIILARSGSERTLLKNENLRTVNRFSTENVAKMYIEKIFKF